MERIIKFFKVKKPQQLKKWIYILSVCAIVFWVCFRIVALILQHNQDVFNISRDISINGTPVLTMTAQNSSGVLHEPITVEKNKAYVTGNRVGLFRAGQKVGNGKITSVSQNINLDTGMYVIKTSNVENGLQYVEYTRNGYFVPVYAVVDDNVFVYENGVATLRKVIVAHSDADVALITQGLHDGDIVILSKVSSGERVRIEKQGE
ncbi:MAG: hypothetical protein IKP24_02640 [Alphaproteobacteria bacterium]|nr:hypothetical protein [Alphaproteobacteria bacterium]